MLLGGIAGFQTGLAQPVNTRIANGVELLDQLAIILGIGRVALKTNPLHRINHKVCCPTVLDGHGPNNVLQRF